MKRLAAAGGLKADAAPKGSVRVCPEKLGEQAHG
jgi:hypothetical protein